MSDRLIWFANNFNPNRDTAEVEWPKYEYTEPSKTLCNPSVPTLLDFWGNNSLSLIHDTYREDPIDLAMELNFAAPWP